jgi:hypothetical protein
MIPYPTRKMLQVLLLVMGIALLTYRAVGPPVPHGIAGYIFQSDGATQVPLGTAYSINDSNSSHYVTGTTSNPIPGMSGRYFETINGTDGDIVIVTAWNATMYGRTNVTLFGTMDNINVTINMTRSVELNISITFPFDGAVLSIGNYSNVSATIKVLGADGIDCNVTISFSHELVANITDTESFTHSLGSPSRGTTISTWWNISADSMGRVNITVTGSCENEGMYVEANKYMRVYDVLVTDTVPPVVQLVAPSNNSVILDNNNVHFYYNVSDASDIANCTLIINGKYNQTNTTAVIIDTRLNISQYLTNGLYNWSVNCTDAAGNEGAAVTFNISLEVHWPTVTLTGLQDPVNLVSATTLQVDCNATVTDLNGVADILMVNATLFDMAWSDSSDSDDNNYHYSTACQSTANTSVGMNVTCSFDVWYYANSGAWICSVTAYDKNTLVNSSNHSTLVEELYAIGVASFLDFGNLMPGAISQDVNLTLYNYGNRDINVTVHSYGLQEEDNLSMVCWDGGNISVDRMRYALEYQTNFNSMVNLTAEPLLIAEAVLRQRTEDSGYGNDTNRTYWKLGPPLGLKGQCNGTMVFGALQP